MTEIEESEQSDSTASWKLVAAVVSLAALSFAGAIAADALPFERLIAPPLHSVCEAVSGFACLALAVLLLLLRRSGAQAYVGMLFPASGLLAMGVLDLFHASVPVGNAFVWLRACASAAGGVGFALLALPERLARSKPAHAAPALFLGGALGFGALSVALHPLLPALLVGDGGLTDLARAVGLASGTLYAVALLALLSRHRRLPAAELLFLATFCLLQGMADYLFVSSRLWTQSWWWWHLLRVVAAVVLLSHALRLYATLQARLTDALAARDEFVSLAAHDLRTPLTAMRLNAQLLVRVAQGRSPTGAAGATAPEARRDVENRAGKLVAQVDRLVALVNHLLDVSKIRAGRLELRRESVDLGAIVSQCLNELEPVLVAAKCPVDTDVAPGVRGEWDATRLSQVVSNLLTNATKYGSGKPIQVRLVRARGRVRLTVRDFGIGVASEDQARIFGRFERAVSPSAYGGLGLGLYISRAIVEAHGGRISVESEPGAGSTFVVELPCDGAPALAQSAGPQRVRRARFALRG